METTANKKGAASPLDLLIESAKVSKIGIDDVMRVLEHILSAFELCKDTHTTGEEVRLLTNRRTIGSMISIIHLRLMDISEDLGNQLDRIDD
jgi:hypothetical protein